MDCLFQKQVFKAEGMYSTQCLSLQDGAYGRVYNRQVLSHCRANMWTDTTGVNIVRLLHKLGVLEAHGRVYKNCNVEDI